MCSVIWQVFSPAAAASRIGAFLTGELLFDTLTRRRVRSLGCSARKEEAVKAAVSSHCGSKVYKERKKKILNRKMIMQHIRH